MGNGTKRIAAVVTVAALGLGIAAWAGALSPGDAQAGQANDGALGITVTGLGSVTATPNQASFSFGVETQGQTADEALTKNSAAVKKVIDAVKATGVPAADIQTQQVSVFPRYSNDGNVIIGYTASNSVNVTIRDLAKVSDVVEAATKAGANQVYGPNLTVSNQKALYNQALAKALDDARSKATTIAKAAGVSLGRVVNIVEGGGFGPLPAAEAAAGGDKGVPIEPGQQELQASLSVTFAIS